MAGVAARNEALDARLAENRNLALIVSESLKQMTDRAKAMGSMAEDSVIAHQETEARLLTLLAEDPVFNRLSIYNPSGELVYTSHLGSARPHLAGWLAEVNTHFGADGSGPLLPNRKQDPTYVPGEPAWRLPFLVPVGPSDHLSSYRLVLIELDIGYLSGLLQHVELGEGFIQVLDSAGGEWMRANESGVVVGGPSVPAQPQTNERSLIAGEADLKLGGEYFQYVFVSRPRNGFKVTVAQPFDEILTTLWDTMSAICFCRRSPGVFSECWATMILPLALEGMSS